MIQPIIEYGSTKIAYSPEQATGKRLRIIVTPRLEVRVRVPRGVSPLDVNKAVQSKAGWIARQLERQERHHPLPGPKKYVSGETIVYLGRQYRLKIEQGSEPCAGMYGRYLRIVVPDARDRESVREAVRKWYRQRAEDVFARYAERCFEVGARHGIPSVPIHLRWMRSRWGACSTKNRVTLNLHLIQAPVHCIEYVIMHELCHLVHHNHSKAFYRLLRRCMPDWEARRALLDGVRIEI